MVSHYTELQVYQRAYKIALDIHKETLDFPKIEQYAIANQLRRATKGICANIAEGFGKQHRSKPEFKRFLLIAIGSSDEATVWLNFCKDLGYISDENFTLWTKEYQEISKMLNGLINNWKGN